MAADEGGYVDDLYEVESGYHTHTDRNGRTHRLEPGATFHPTRQQVESGALKGKASIAKRDTSRQFGGADIGVRSLPMTDAALELALEAGLEEGDFDGVEPTGADGDYLKSQVRELAEG